MYNNVRTCTILYTYIGQYIALRNIDTVYMLVKNLNNLKC